MNYLSEVYGDSGLYAKVVAASIANNIPIYTLEIQCPKYLNAELNTHRIISKNYSSSRAIPLQSILDSEFYLPIDIRKNQKGMQGYSNITEEELYNLYLHLFRLYEDIDDVLTAIDIIIAPHKQTSSRYREPFTLQKGIFTATEWDNFFRLRLAPDAQPEIQELAKCMKSAIDQAIPTVLHSGQWHLPYVNVINEEYNLEIYKKESAARCARVSYNNHDNSSPSVEKDLALAELLLSSKHLTPFEHQASPMPYINTEDCYDVAEGLWWEWQEHPGITHQDKEGNLWSGNFRGFLQYRQMISAWNS